MKTETKKIVGREGRAVTVRFPPGLVEALDKAAVEDGRSRNTEIIVILTNALALRRRRKRK